MNVAAADVTWRDYHGGVADAVGVTPTWSDVSGWMGGPPWTGEYVTARARSWGWEPTVTFDQALQELADGFDPEAVPDHLRWW